MHAVSTNQIADILHFNDNEIETSDKWHDKSLGIFICTLQEFRSNPPEVFLGKGVLKICSKFTGEHPCRSATSIKLQSNFNESALRHGCSSVNLLHIFRATS